MIDRTASTLRLVVVAGLSAAALTSTCGGPAGDRRPIPDLILHNGHVVTVDDAFSSAEAVAIADGRFIAVGTSASVVALAGPETRSIDLEGRTVIPGLADDHFHDAGGGPGVDLSRSRSMADVLEAIARRVAETPAGEVIVTNSDWHEAQLTEQRLPLRRDLDTVSPDHPVVVVRGGHEYILNSAALARWSIDTQTSVPPGGRMSRYPDGELDGELVDAAKRFVTLPVATDRSPDEQLADLAAEHATLHAAGLTTLRLAGISPERYRLLQEARRRGGLTMRLNVLLRPDVRSAPDDVLATVDGWGIVQDEGDDWLRVGGVKLGVDGGFEGGWMREPYAAPFDQGGTFFGLQTMPSDRYIAIVRALNARGWRVATHAVGDAAIDLVLEAYEAAEAERSIVGRRWSLEHGFIVGDDQFPRMKALDLVISAQDHLYLAGPSLVTYWGPERAARTTPVRSYLEHGLVVAGGTDSAVVPYPPLWALYHFVTRDTITGGVFGLEQGVTREEALRMMTTSNAHLTFEESTKGSIEPGKLGDLVVLSDDLLTCSAAELEHVQVLLTVVGGRIVYRADAFGDGGTHGAN